MLKFHARCSAAKALLTFGVAPLLFPVSIVAGQEVRTSDIGLEIPSVDTIDDNGVDLLTGSLTLKSPSLTLGDGATKREFYLSWNGRQWLPNIPSLWVDKDYHVFISDGGVTDEFANGKKAENVLTGMGQRYVYEHIRPNFGASLECYITGGLSGDGWFSTCTYVSRDGKNITFAGVLPINASFPKGGVQYNYRAYGNNFVEPSSRIEPGMGTTEFSTQAVSGGNDDQIGVGNIAIQGGPGYIRVHYPNGYYVNQSATYNSKDVSFSAKSCRQCSDAAIQTITINTPNLSSSNDKDTFLQPKSTTQSITDSAGYVWRYTYNSSSDITKIESPSGYISTITYDGDHRVKTFSNGTEEWSYSYSFSASSKGSGTTTSTDPADTLTLVTHDRKPGPATSVTIKNASGSESRLTRYTYDNYDRITHVYQPEGNYAKFDYDSFGNLSSTKQYSKNQVDFVERTAEYSAQCLKGATCHKPTSIIDANKNATSITYDSLGRPTLVQSPAVDGKIATERYNYGKQTVYYKHTDGSVRANYRTIPVLLSISKCATMQNCVGTADEVVSQYIYASGFAESNSSNNASFTSAVVKNGLGSVIQRTEIVHDAIGNAIYVDGPLSGSADTTAYKFDAMRRQVGEIRPAGTSAEANGKRLATRTTYTGEGQVKLAEQGIVADQSDAAWQSSFAPLSFVATGFDGHGRPSIVASGQSGGAVESVKQTAYDSLNRPQCAVVRMTKDHFPEVSLTGVFSGGELPTSACSLDLSPTDGNSPDRLETKSYNRWGDLLQIRRAVGTTLEQAYATYSYTVNGKQEFVIDANGNKAKMTYDGFDRLQRWYFPSKTPVETYAPTTQAAALAQAGNFNDADFEEYSYDANGNRKTFRKRDGSTLRYNYDALNRVTEKLVPGRSELSATATQDVYYAYDLQGRQVDARFGRLDGEGIHTTYDALGRLTAETSTMDGIGRTVSSAYDANSNRTYVTQPDGAYTRYTYDNLNRLQSAWWGWTGVDGETQFANVQYNEKGLRKELARGPISTSYGYDGANRLSSLAQAFTNSAGNLTETIGYNPASQIISTTRSNDAYAYTGNVNVNRSYGVNGLNQYSSVAGQAFCYDANGNLTADGTFVYQYDVENRLVAKRSQTNTDCSSLSYSGALKASLRYDPIGRLYETVGDVTGTTRMAYDGDKLIAEYNAAGNLLRRYMWGDRTDEPWLWDEGGLLTCSGTHFLSVNHQGSVIANADCNGSLTRIIAYDEYGIPKASDSGPLVPSNGGRFLYTGQAFQAELGMYYYKARMYSPTLGRFMQTDPIGYEDQVNLYGYVANDPVNKADPDGKQTVMGPVYDGLDRATAACGGDAQCGLKAWNEIQRGVAENVAVTAATELTGTALFRGAAWVARGASASYYGGRAAASFGRTFATPALKAARDAGVKVLKQNPGVNNALGKVWGSGLKDAQTALQRGNISAPEGLTKEVAGAYRSSLDYQVGKAIDTGNKLMYDISTARLEILSRMGF